MTNVSFSRIALSLSVAGLVAGCVVRVAAPPPPPTYVPPDAPAPVDAAPATEAAVQVNEAPPPLPVYEQPPCPGDGYLWTPGYWAYGPGGYYWVPGTWVLPPTVGLLWTPGYWAFVGGVYAWHVGYWGPHVGFYGGVNYGFGYTGVGFAGGRWVGNSFAYNRAVTNVNVTVVHNIYHETVINNVTVNRVSYNGGAGGLNAVPNAHERMVAMESHVPATALQHRHIEEAARNPDLFARANGGHPSIAATSRPAAFSGAGVVGAHGAHGFIAGEPNNAHNPGMNMHDGPGSNAPHGLGSNVNVHGGAGNNGNMHGGAGTAHNGTAGTAYNAAGSNVHAGAQPGNAVKHNPNPQPYKKHPEGAEK